MKIKVGRSWVKIIRTTSLWETYYFVARPCIDRDCYLGTGSSLHAEKKFIHENLMLWIIELKQTLWITKRWAAVFQTDLSKSNTQGYTIMSSLKDVFWQCKCAENSHIYTDMDNSANRKSWVEAIWWEDDIKSDLRKTLYEGVQWTPLKGNCELGIQTSNSPKFWEILNILDGSHPTFWDTAGSIMDMDVTLIDL
jgi:hypothetical protein